jgi:hypothetical protein
MPDPDERLREKIKRRRERGKAYMSRASKKNMERIHRGAEKKTGAAKPTGETQESKPAGGTPFSASSPYKRLISKIKRRVTTPIKPYQGSSSINASERRQLEEIDARRKRK